MEKTIDKRCKENERGEREREREREREWKKYFVYSQEASVSLKTDVVQLLSVAWENQCVYKYMKDLIIAW